MAYDPRTRRQNPSWVPDYDPTGRQDASGENTPPPPPPGGGGGSGGGAGDLWSQLMAMLKGYAGPGGLDMFEQNRSKLDPFITQAMKDWGLDDSTLLSKVAYNPLKAMYTMNSFLTGTPYYDKGNAADGSETWSPFYVPNWDYDPATPGVQAPSWAKNPYDPNAHVFRT